MQIAVKDIQLLAEGMVDADQLLRIVEDIPLVIDIGVGIETRRNIGVAGRYWQISVNILEISLRGRRDVRHLGAIAVAGVARLAV